MQSNQLDRLSRLIANFKRAALLDRVANIYDLSWLAVSDLEITGKIESQDELVNISELKDAWNRQFFFDYRRAVGSLLGLYVAKRISTNSFDSNFATEALDAIKSLKWHENTGEVIFAYSLLAREVRGLKEDLDQLSKLCLAKVTEALTGYNEFMENGIDISYMILTLASLDDGVARRMMEFLSGNKLVMHKIIESAPAEVLAVLLWSVTLLQNRFSSVNSDLGIYASSLGSRLLAEVSRIESVSIDHDFFEQIMEAISLIKEGLGSRAKETYGNMIKEYSNNSLILDLTNINVGRPNVSLAAKMKIALFKSGFLKPFMLSSNESAIYRQIQEGSKHGLKFIRKHELIGFLVSLGVLLELVLYYVLRTLPLGSPISTGALLSVYADIAWGIWREGEITKNSVMVAFRDIKSHLKRG